MRSYDVTAEFYDLLHAPEYLRHAERLLDRWLGRPTVGVLDVGAGTGLATVALAARCAVDVHVVEPAAAMRAVMLSRLARDDALLARVTVHTGGAEQLTLTDAIDVAICFNMMSTLDSYRRRAALTAIARAVVPGGRLIIQRPPSEPGPQSVPLPERIVGPHRYTGVIDWERVGPGRVRWRFTYRVRRGEETVREVTEVFDGYLVDAVVFDGELRDCGFEPVACDTTDIVIASRR